MTVSSTAQAARVAAVETSRKQFLDERRVERKVRACNHCSKHGGLSLHHDGPDHLGLWFWRTVHQHDGPDRLGSWGALAGGERVRRAREEESAGGRGAGPQGAPVPDTRARAGEGEAGGGATLPFLGFPLQFRLAIAWQCILFHNDNILEVKSSNEAMLPIVMEQDVLQAAFSTAFPEGSAVCAVQSVS